MNSRIRLLAQAGSLAGFVFSAWTALAAMRQVSPAGNAAVPLLVADLVIYGGTSADGQVPNWNPNCKF